jgi:hypothetical protein
MWKGHSCISEHVLRPPLLEKGQPHAEARHERNQMQGLREGYRRFDVLDNPLLEGMSQEGTDEDNPTV